MSRERWIITSKGQMHPTEDLFAEDGAIDDGACWHRWSAVEWFGETEFQASRAHFWCHDSMGTQPYFAVMDDFGNLARVADY